MLTQYKISLILTQYNISLLLLYLSLSYNYFKISPQSDTFTLVKAMRIIYSSNLILILFSNVEIAVNMPEA